MVGEFDLIQRYFRREAAADQGVELGIGDDAALLRVPAGCELVAAVDTLVEGRHFPTGSDPRSIGHRALAVNLSDFAAMGATPAWATLALTLPDADPAWLEAFAAGLFELADRHRVTLVGGDTTGGPLTISIQLLGHAPHAAAMRRSGGRAGDLIAVSGSLGDAAAGLALLQGGLGGVAAAAAAELRRRFEFPTPRVELGLALRGLAHAAMDLSDGLVGDLPKLAASSGLAAAVEVAQLPLSAALRAATAAPQARDWALGGGDDYELLIALPRERWSLAAQAALALGTSLTVVGELRSGAGVRWSENGAPFVPSVRGYEHFR
jgi:thiamine-monophosphate kinase